MTNDAKSLISRVIGIFAIAGAFYGYLKWDLKLIFGFVAIGFVSGLFSVYFKAARPRKDKDQIALETLSKLNKK